MEGGGSPSLPVTLILLLCPALQISFVCLLTFAHAIAADAAMKKVAIAGGYTNMLVFERFCSTDVQVGFAPCCHASAANTVTQELQVG